MSHALADVVHVYLSTGCLHGQHDYCNAPQRPDGTGKRAAECKFCGAPCRCPCHGTTAALSYDTESTTAAVLHAVDNLTDGYPALIPADQLADDDTRPVRRCDATGNTIRGPVVPVEEAGRERRYFCLRCFDAYRRSVAHLDDPLPLSEGPVL